MTMILQELMRVLDARSTEFPQRARGAGGARRHREGLALRVADDVAACVLWREATARDLQRPDGTP